MPGLLSVAGVRSQEVTTPRQEALSGTLDYPPEGSPQAKTPAKGKAG